jgi:hypothetical protein
MTGAARGHQILKEFEGISHSTHPGKETRENVRNIFEMKYSKTSITHPSNFEASHSL